VLENVARQTGRRPKALDGSEIPLELAYLWGWFQELSATRGSNGWGPNPITYTEVATWARLTGTIIRPMEVRLIMTLDGLFRIAVSEASEQRRLWLEQKRAAE
jgi:hypothetical protein